MKICIQPIKSKEQSKEVQEKAFKLGYGWERGRNKKIKDYDAKSLYLYVANNDITYSNNSENQNSSDIILTPEEFIEADMEKSDWINWVIVEKYVVPIISRWEILDLS